MRRAGGGTSLVAALSLGAIWFAVATAAGATPRATVDAVGAVGITVSDLDRSVAFYRDVLSFKVTAEDEAAAGPVEQLEGVFGAHVRSARLELGPGKEAIVLTQYLAPRGRAIPADARSNDRTFQHVAIVVADMERAYAHLRAHAVRHVSTEPQTLPPWNRAAAGIKAFYFADPDDHTLEVIWFPPGKGDPRWQRPRGGEAPLFLGIDHTAIAVGDTARSLRFYRDTLGMRVAGESENYGTEQEHLNNVFGAHLHITGLRGAAGPGIELLEYLTPRDGRPPPADLRANDLAHWQTVVRTGDVTALARRALDAGGAAVSPALVERTDPAYRLERARLIRDPDGHGLLIGQ
jgi:catechol 2,3-dioxygenase-like lactoylglutathione lyase family enzyme